MAILPIAVRLALASARLTRAQARRAAKRQGLRTIRRIGDFPEATEEVIDIEGIFDQMADRAEDLTIRRKRRIARRLVRIAKQEVPVITGRLRNSIRITRETIDLTRIEATVEYAKYVEFGTARFAGRRYMRRTFNKAKSLLRGTLTVVNRGHSIRIPWSDLISITYRRRMTLDPRIELTVNFDAIDDAIAKEIENIS